MQEEKIFDRDFVNIEIWDAFTTGEMDERMITAINLSAGHGHVTLLFFYHRH